MSREVEATVRGPVTGLAKELETLNCKPLDQLGLRETTWIASGQSRD